MNLKQPEIHWRYLIRTRRYLVASIVSGLLAVILVLAVIWPMIQQSLDIRSEYDREIIKLRALQNKAEALQRADTVTMVDKAPRINVLLPSKKPLLELMSGLSLQAEASGIRFTNISATPGKISTESAQPAATRGSAAPKSKGSTAVDNVAEKLLLEVEVEGTLEQINAFFAGIERMAPMTDVSSIELNEAKTTSAGGIEEELFRAKLDIITFYFTKSIAATVDAPLPELDRAQAELLAALDSFEYAPINESTTVRGGGLIDLFGVSEATSDVASSAATTQ